jgi:hypothetical protein
MEGGEMERTEIKCENDNTAKSVYSTSLDFNTVDFWVIHHRVCWDETVPVSAIPMEELCSFQSVAVWWQERGFIDSIFFLF